MAKPRRKEIRLSDVCDALETLAPLRLAQSWDNVGLLAGDCDATVTRAMLCIDLTPRVVDEAIRRRVQLVVAYHPPLFKAIKRLTASSNDTDAAILRCIRAGIAIYSTHTALDAAENGTNECIADLCGMVDTQPLEYTGGVEGTTCKVVVFVPITDADKVADAMFLAGAGRIGDYEKCSYRLSGTGTFLGGKTTHPSVGSAGRYETVEEVRLESVTPRAALPAVIEAIRGTHPYEEPAFDVYPLHAAPERGIGRYGPLPRPVTLSTFAKRLKKSTGAPGPQIVGDPNRKVDRAIICVGAAGSLPFSIPVRCGDVIVTGEIRHHDALTILRRDCSAVALGHWSSERPVLDSFAQALSRHAKPLKVLLSAADHEPFSPV